jgi:hypothetical protein
LHLIDYNKKKVGKERDLACYGKERGGIGELVS